MSRWKDAIALINRIEDGDIREALLALYRLIEHTFDLIPEVE